MTTHPDDLVPLAGRLRALFQAADYTVDGVDAMLGPMASAALGRGDLTAALQAASGNSELDVLIRLFLLGQDEPAANAGFLPAALIEPAAEDRVRATLDLRPHDSQWWVAADISGPGRPPAPDHVIGIGSASMTLLTATINRPVDRALDIGTGCGIQALHLTRTARSVTATDAVARAVAMARLSFALSGLEPDAIELLTGDLLAPVSGREFDLVVCNPPFVLAPSGPDALAYRDAASDDGRLGRLLEDAASVLAPGGMAQVLTSWLIRAGESWQQPPAAILPVGCDAIVMLREVLDPAQHVALWRDDDEPEPVATRRALRWLEHVQRLGAEGIAYGMVVLRRVDREPRVSFVDLRGDQSSPSGDRLGAWLDRAGTIGGAGGELDDLHLQVADGTRLLEESVPADGGWTPVQRRLTCAAALPETVGIDETTAALLAGCDGRLPVGAIAELLAVATGAPADGVRRVVRHLFESGHLKVAPQHDVTPE